LRPLWCLSTIFTFGIAESFPSIESSLEKEALKALKEMELFSKAHESFTNSRLEWKMALPSLKRKDSTLPTDDSAICHCRSFITFSRLANYENSQNSIEHPRFSPSPRLINQIYSERLAYAAS
jgi:hypothetical protein